MKRRKKIRGRLRMNGGRRGRIRGIVRMKEGEGDEEYKRGGRGRYRIQGRGR